MADGTGRGPAGLPKPDAHRACPVRGGRALPHYTGPRTKRMPGNRRTTPNPDPQSRPLPVIQPRPCDFLPHSAPIPLCMPPTRPSTGRNPADRDGAVAHAASALVDGRAVVLPTETVYGIFTRATLEAVNHLDSFTVKPEPGLGPRVTLHLPDIGALRDLLDLPHATTRRLIERLCPGPVRFVLDQPAKNLASIRKRLGAPADLIDDSARIAFRVPDHPIARRVLRDVKAPCVARRLGSAFWSIGEDPGTSTAIMPDDPSPGPAVVVDDGPTLHRVPSTTVRITADGRIQVDPGGAVSERAVMANLERLVLFVCTGNTCRSPMAEHIARWVESKAPPTGVTTRFASAGISAMDGVPAAPDAASALGAMGVPLTDHISRPLTPEMIEQAEVIYTMTPSHAEAVMHAAPEAAHKIFPLADAEPVDDPLGHPIEVYRRTADQIERLVRARLATIAP